MKTTENIDELIKKTLNAEEATFYDNLDEQNLTGMLSGLYTGKLKWFTMLMTLSMVLIFAGGVYCAIEFFQAEASTEMLKWGAGVFLSFMAVSFLKLINFIQMYTNKLSREIKRLEFQISLLVSKE